jgi:hypothetical protein
VADALTDFLELVRLQRRRLHRAASSGPRRHILALAIARGDGGPSLLDQARGELMRSRHDVTFATKAAGDRGKFENLNELLATHSPTGCDWLLVLDDDVTLPADFLDVFIFLAERFELALAQPAHRRRSHAAWEVSRRRPGSVVRETAFVEIGPVFAFHASTFDELLPFPFSRFGWGLDSHWSALARANGWRLGVVDATAIAHGVRRIASGYDRDAARAESREFLRDRPHITPADAMRTLAVHRSWR